MSDEPRYTLADAKRVFNRQACVTSGHPWRVEVEVSYKTVMGNLVEEVTTPKRIYCERCGRAWAIIESRPEAAP